MLSFFFVRRQVFVLQFQGQSNLAKKTIEAYNEFLFQGKKKIKEKDKNILILFKFEVICRVSLIGIWEQMRDMEREIKKFKKKKRKTEKRGYIILLSNMMAH